MAVVQVERVGLIDEVCHEEIQITVALHVAERNAHAGLGPAKGVQGGAVENGLVDEATVSLVLPELVGLAVVGDIEVEPAVAGEIRADDAKARCLDAVDAARPGDVGEGAVAVVLVKGVALVGKTLGATVIGGTVGLDADFGGIELDVVEHVEIQQPVTVVVAKGRRGRPVISRDPR